MSVDLTKWCVLVTGASSGIGRACAEVFAARGCRLLLAARRKDRLDELSSSLHERHGTEALTTSLDVRDRSAVETWVDGLPGDWREIDILVNNAGLSRGMEPLHEGDISDWEEMIDTNVKGLLYVTRAVLPGMVDRGHGHVINIGSIAGHEVYPGGAVYCATKHAVTALNRGLAIDTLGTGAGAFPRRCRTRVRGLRRPRSVDARRRRGSRSLLRHPPDERERPRDDPDGRGAGVGGARSSQELRRCGERS